MADIVTLVPNGYSTVTYGTVSYCSVVLCAIVNRWTVLDSGTSNAVAHSRPALDCQELEGVT